MKSGGTPRGFAMGVVYEARDNDLDRKIALKLLASVEAGKAAVFELQVPDDYRALSYNFV